MTIPDWNITDYYVDFDPIYVEGEITNAPIIVKVVWVNKFLQTIIFPDAFKAVMNGGELSGLLMGFSIVDYLAGYYYGKNSGEKKFILFLNRYFPEVYKSYSKEIYQQLRCGMVHNLALMNPWNSSETQFIVEKKSDFHLMLQNGKVVFSILHFIEDSSRAGIMFLHDLIMKPEENQKIIENFNKRFNKQKGTASMMVKTD